MYSKKEFDEINAENTKIKNELSININELEVRNKDLLIMIDEINREDFESKFNESLKNNELLQEELSQLKIKQNGISFKSKNLKDMRI